MKKYLFIFFCLVSSFSFSDIDYSEILSNIEYIQSDIMEDTDSINNDVCSIREDISSLFSEFDTFLNSEEGFFSLFGEVYLFGSYIESIYHIFNNLPYGSQLEYLISSTENLISSTDSIFYHLSDNWQDISNGFAQNHADLVSIRTAIHDLEMTQEGYLSGANGYLQEIGYGLTDIIEILQSQYGSSSSDLPKMEIGYYPLNSFGKDVDIKGLSLSTLETTGEYNKDVHRLLINLNQIGSSQNNVALSILTNVQIIATALSQDAEGQDKLEKDLEDKEYQATKAEAELSGITSQNWDSSFTPPRYLSDVHSRLSVSLSDPGLPSEITVMDRFYYETAYFNLEIDSLTFQVPKPLVDLANYGRIVFGFIYWSLTFFIALYLFRLWIKLYMYVSNTLINR